MLEFIVNHLWQSSLFTIGIAAFVCLLRNNSASIRYWLWLAASIKFLIPFALLIALGNQFQLPIKSNTDLNMQAHSDWAQSDWLPLLEKIVEPAKSNEVSINLKQYSNDSNAQGPIALPTYAARPVSITLTSFTDSLSPGIVLAIAKIQSNVVKLFAIIWLLGTMLVLAHWLKAWLTLKGIVDRAVFSNQFGFLIRIKVSSEITVPGVFGLFRKTLLLPENFVDSLDKKSRAAILAHEAMHLKRHDNATAALHKLVQSIFWFHPLAYWIGKQLNVERELACDEAVIRQGHDPKAYAEGIITVCQHSVSAPLLCAVGSSGKTLSSRIQLIISTMKTENVGWIKRTGLAVFASFTLMLPVLVGTFQVSEALAGSGDGKTTKFEHISLSKGFKEASNVGFFLTPMGGFEVSHWSLLDVIGVAHDVQGVQVEAPDWVVDQYVNISAFGGPVVSGPADENANHIDKNQVLVMGKVRQLLQDKFNLAAHKEKRYQQTYALVIDTEVKAMEVAKANARAPRLDTRPTGVKMNNIKMSTFLWYLSRQLDRPIVDNTNLKEKYNFYLDFGAWAEGGLKPKPTLKQLQYGLKELGLRLEPKMDYVDILKIDHIEQAPEIAIARN